MAFNFESRIVEPLRKFCTRNVDVSTVISGFAAPWRLRRPGNLLARAYMKYLFGAATLADLPDVPDFTLLAAELHSGASFFWPKENWIMGDWLHC